MGRVELHSTSWATMPKTPPQKATYSQHLATSKPVADGEFEYRVVDLYYERSHASLPQWGSAVFLRHRGTIPAAIRRSHPTGFLLGAKQILCFRHRIKSFGDRV